MMRDATISECGQYRYDLQRTWGADGMLLWVMLNPSTADAHVDDPTIRRCISFTQRKGYGSLVVVNLFALRATRPIELLRHPSPVGPENARHIERHMSDADAVVLAWGAWWEREQSRLGGRGLPRLYVEGIARRCGTPMFCLGRTKRLQPRHPLYVRGDVEFEPWRDD